jgi:hypothetical protein
LGAVVVLKGENLGDDVKQVMIGGRVAQILATTEKGVVVQLPVGQLHVYKGKSSFPREAPKEGRKGADDTPWFPGSGHVFIQPPDLPMEDLVTDIVAVSAGGTNSGAIRIDTTPVPEGKPILRTMTVHSADGKDKTLTIDASPQAPASDLINAAARILAPPEPQKQTPGDAGGR